MTTVEALADAIMSFEGWRIGSRSYRNRNPGNLRASPFAVSVDSDHYAQFESLSVGYAALIHDLTAKVTGQSQHALTEASTLLDLVNCYAPAGDQNNPSAYTAYICRWLTEVFARKFEPTTRLGKLGSMASVV